MNREEFKQHFILALNELRIENPSDSLYTVEPCFEPDKGYKTYDDIMRLQVLPKARTMSFEQVIGILTLWEGYFPCWIDIGKRNNDIVLKTSLRMRKVQKKDNVGMFPFRIVIDFKEVELQSRLPHIVRHAFYLIQMRGSMFNLDNIYDRIPSTYCIFPIEDSEASLKILLNALESFQGNCKWCVFKGPFSRKNLYVISTEAVRKYEQECFEKEKTCSEQEYFGEQEYKLLCENAVADMEELCNWVYQKVNS
jgi:hypothetical protein